jgi:hypothetical protein
MAHLGAQRQVRLPSLGIGLLAGESHLGGLGLGQRLVEAHECLEHGVVDAGAGTHLGQAEGLAPAPRLEPVEANLEVGPVIGWRGVQQVAGRRAEGVGEGGEGSQLGFQATVLELAQVGRRPADPLAERRQCQPGQPSVVAHPVAQNDRVVVRGFVGSGGQRPSRVRSVAEEWQFFA